MGFEWAMVYSLLVIMLFCIFSEDQDYLQRLNPKMKCSIEDWSELDCSKLS